MKEGMTTAETTIDKDQTATFRPLTGPMATPKVPNDYVNIVNADTMPRMSVKLVLKVERMNNFAMSAEVTLPTL